MNLFCLLAIGCELLSVGNLFCWFQMVASECWQELQVLFWVGMYLGRKKIKNKTYSRVFENAATGKSNVRVCSRVFTHPQMRGQFLHFVQNAAIGPAWVAFKTRYGSFYSCVFPQP